MERQLSDLRISAAVRGRLDEFMKEEARAIAKAATTAARTAAYGAERDLEGQIKRMVRSSRKATRGDHIKNLVRVKADPVKGYELEAVARTYSKATYKRGGRVGRRDDIDLLAIFDQETRIQANGSGWIAIPTKLAPMARGGRGSSARRAFPREVAGQHKTQFIRISANRAVIVAGARREVWWVLVKEVRLRKRLDVAKVHEKRSAGVMPRFLKELAKEDSRLQRKYTA